MVLMLTSGPSMSLTFPAVGGTALLCSTMEPFSSGVTMKLVNWAIESAALLRAPSLKENLSSTTMLKMWFVD